MNVVVRSAANAAALTNAVRQQIRELDSDLPVYQVRTYGAARGGVAFAPALLTAVAWRFRPAGAGPCGVGIYGVMAFLVNQGTREIGIRMALGATSGVILAMVLRRAMALAAVGIAIGLAAAIPLARLLRTMLFGIRESDALTFAAASILLGAVRSGELSACAACVSD